MRRGGGGVWERKLRPGMVVVCTRRLHGQGTTVYHELVLTLAGEYVMRGVTAAEPGWLVDAAPGGEGVGWGCVGVVARVEWESLGGGWWVVRFGGVVGGLAEARWREEDVRMSVGGFHGVVSKVDSACQDCVIV